MITSWPLNVASASGVPPYTIDRHQPGSPWELKGKFTFPHSHSCELTNWWIESHHPVCRTSTTSKDMSKLVQWRPRSSLNYGLQVYLQTCSIRASKLARSQPQSLSLNMLNHGLQSRSIMASKCIPNLACSQPPITSANLLDHGVRVHHQTSSITTCKFVRLRPPSTYLQTRSITASKIISTVSQLRPPQVHLQTPSITISECISRFTRSRPSNVFWNIIDYHLQDHFQSGSIMGYERISEFTGSSFWGAPRIALKCCLQSIQIYRV